MKRLTIKDVILRIVSIIMMAEFLVMLVLRAVPHQASTITEAVLDAAALAFLSTPAIYIWVVKPFVNARDDALARVRHLANVDPLTQLANRRLLVNYLEKALASSIRHKDHGAVLLMDLDGFKAVNDRYGHLAGDRVLVDVAQRLQAAVRADDVVGRLGGDEFIVLLHRLGANEDKARERAFRVAEKLISVIAHTISFEGQSLSVGASVGIRLIGFEKRDTEVVMGEADTAMYSAKQRGGGRAVFFGD